MTCNNYINGICILNREACKFVSVGEGCPSCKATSMPVASFRQLADTYAEMSDCSVRRKKTALMLARRMAEAIGLGYDDPADLGENEYDLAFNRFKHGNPDGSGGSFDLSTIELWFSIWRTMCGKGNGETAQKIRKALKEMRVRPPHTDEMPIFKVPRKPIRELTDDEIQQLEDKIVLLRHSEKKRERMLGLWLDIEAETGARPSDLMVATWGWFRQDPDRGWVYEFVPRKTARKTNGRKVIGRLSTPFLTRLKAVKGNANEQIFAVDARYSRKKSMKNGAYSGKSYYLNALANKVVREIIGKESHMAQYLLRRLKSKRMLETEGMIAEAQALGHSPRIAFGHYTNFENLKTGGMK